MKQKKLLGIVIWLMAVFIVTSCLSVSHGPLSPNASQSVITVKRSSSEIEKNKPMEVYIDGRQQKTVANGGQEQSLVMNGLHNIYVKVGKKFQSQMLTFDCSSEVIEFFANFEGSKGVLGLGSTMQLNLTKISGGDGQKTASNSNVPAISITVDNSSSNTASSSGNTSTSNVNVGDDNSVR